MWTWAEQACALLISSGLPQCLWEEAIKRSTWLQNQTPTQVLDGKTLYEYKKKKKNFTLMVSKSSVMLHAGKPDVHTCIGHFVR